MFSLFFTKSIIDPDRIVINTHFLADKLEDNITQNFPTDQIIFSRCSAELEGKTLHFKCNESFMNSGVYQLYFEED